MEKEIKERDERERVRDEENKVREQKMREMEERERVREIWKQKTSQFFSCQLPRTC